MTRPSDEEMLVELEVARRAAWYALGRKLLDDDARGEEERLAAIAADAEARARVARQAAMERIVGIVVALAVGLLVLLGLTATAGGGDEPCRLTMTAGYADCAEHQSGPGFRIDWPW